MRMWKLVSLIPVLALGGCLSPSSIQCPDGLVCPVGTHCAAKESVCIKDSCGDGVVEAGEVCDDGNTVSGDGCSADC
ncbi:MAG TPA: DUF4215 domain-containing protein, partial [Polyangia bacterium]|nr:DUF4215 domain-containing protein [Polyangia bacterium]